MCDQMEYGHAKMFIPEPTPIPKLVKVKAAKVVTPKPVKSKVSKKPKVSSAQKRLI